MAPPAPVRPLPQPTLASAGFWRSGADGVLRISRCDDCGRYFHPPMPVCPSCRSRAVALAPTSGKAVVVGFSVNHDGRQVENARLAVVTAGGGVPSGAMLLRTA